MDDVPVGNLCKDCRYENSGPGLGSWVPASPASTTFVEKRVTFPQGAFGDRLEEQLQAERGAHIQKGAPAWGLAPPALPGPPARITVPKGGGAALFAFTVS